MGPRPEVRALGVAAEQGRCDRQTLEILGRKRHVQVRGGEMRERLSPRFSFKRGAAAVTLFAHSFGMSRHMIQI
jgi:hypothetical protein